MLFVGNQPLCSQHRLNLLKTGGGQVGVEQDIKTARLDDAQKKPQSGGAFFRQHGHRISPGGQGEQAAAHPLGQVQQLLPAQADLSVVHGDFFRMGADPCL